MKRKTKKARTARLAKKETATTGSLKRKTKTSVSARSAAKKKSTPRAQGAAKHGPTKVSRSPAEKGTPRAQRAAKKGSTQTSRSAATQSTPRGAGTQTARTTPAHEKTSDALGTYRSKRDFKKTPEPAGKHASSWKKDRNPIFVVQKHAATRLHYDFRLEIGGVLKSWAVPKGPSMNPADKRLAVGTEDHPLDYADFEGVIPKGEYGAGTVIVWDAGPYRNLKCDARGNEISMEECYRMGTIEVWLEGKKLRGGYALIHSKMGGNAKNWLLIKMKDGTARQRLNLGPAQDASVMSGRTLEEVGMLTGAKRTAGAEPPAEYGGRHATGTRRRAGGEARATPAERKGAQP